MEQALAMAEAAGYDGFCSAEHYGVADQWDFVVKSAAWMADHM
jgi:alkanesulfonate monooxygenase SsuD/methylene tetrahydromethanopterin reductase-like flavin-dependent oxidoreductase (luciferase family)